MMTSFVDTSYIALKQDTHKVMKVCAIQIPCINWGIKIDTMGNDTHRDTWNKDQRLHCMVLK